MRELKALFDEEMRQLADGGRDFAAAFPEAARRLRFSGGETADPQVERLLEGFAYLTARLRQDLEAEEDGLAVELLEAVAPGLSLPLPSCAVAVFTSQRREAAGPFRLPAGTPVRSRRLPGCRPCRFETEWELVIYPLELTSLRFREDGRVMELELEKSGPGAWPARLPFHLPGDAALAWSLFHWLRRKVCRGSVRTGDVRGDVGIGAMTPSAGKDARLRLRDFLQLEERFRFAELRGLDQLPENCGRASVFLEAEEAFPRSLLRGLKSDSLRLYAVPVINRYEVSCFPQTLEPARIRYPLRPEEDGQELLAVKEIVGLPEAEKHFCECRRRGREMELILSCPRESAGHTLSVTAMAGDGTLPAEHLQPEDLCELDPPLASRFRVCASGRPCAPLAGYGDSRAVWQLLNHVRREADADRTDSLRQLFPLLVDGEKGRRLAGEVENVKVHARHVLKHGVTCMERCVEVTFRDDAGTLSNWERFGLREALGDLLTLLYAEDLPLGQRLLLRLHLLPADLTLEYSDDGG